MMDAKLKTLTDQRREEGRFRPHKWDPAESTFISDVCLFCGKKVFVGDYADFEHCEARLKKEEEAEE